MTATGDAAPPPHAGAAEVITLRWGRAQAAWLMAASILVQALWNPLLLLAVLALLDDDPLDLAAPLPLPGLLIALVLIALTVSVLYGLAKPSDMKLDATGWSAGRLVRLRQPLWRTTAIEPVWSPAFGWRVRVRLGGLQRFFLHSPWVPPWRRRDEAFDNELGALRVFVERHGVRLRPMRRRWAWWSIVASLLIVGELAAIGYAGVRDGVVWPGGHTIERTLEACQALDSAGLATHWPAAERTRQDAATRTYDDENLSVRSCAWQARGETRLSRIELTVTRSKYAFYQSATADAVGEIRQKRRLASDYEEVRAAPGVGDEGYLVQDADGGDARLFFHVANVVVELTVTAREDGLTTERMTLDLGRRVADQLRALSS